jgi:hypothetical protein
VKTVLPRNIDSPQFTVLLAFIITSVSAALCYLSGETEQLWAPGIAFLLPIAPYPRTVLAKAGVALSLMIFLAFAWHGMRRARFCGDGALKVGAESLKVGFISGLFVAATAFLLNSLTILRLAGEQGVGGVLAMSMMNAVFSALWLFTLTLSGLFFGLLGGMFSGGRGDTCIVKVTVKDAPKDRKPGTVRRILLPSLWAVSFGLAGFVLSLQWALSYIYDKASGMHFLSDRIGDMTREYLGFVLTAAALVLINADLTGWDVVYLFLVVGSAASISAAVGFAFAILLPKMRPHQPKTGA